MPDRLSNALPTEQVKSEHFNKGFCKVDCLTGATEKIGYGSFHRLEDACDQINRSFLDVWVAGKRSKKDLDLGETPLHLVLISEPGYPYSSLCCCVDSLSLINNFTL